MSVTGEQMRKIIERRTCDVCLSNYVHYDVDNQKMAEERCWLVVSVPTQVNDLDICPRCAQIIQRALQMGWLSAIVEALVALPR